MLEIVEKTIINGKLINKYDLLNNNIKLHFFLKDQPYQDLFSLSISHII